MNWILVILGILVLSVIIYSQRFKVQRRILGLDMVQFFYLFITAPVVVFGLISLGWKIAMRPEKIVLPIPTGIIFASYALTVAMCLIGVAIHSIATTIHECFEEDVQNPASITNEIFHGPLSHHLIFINGMLVLTLLLLLEINHPDINKSISGLFAISFGVVLGLILTISITWSTYVKSHFTVAAVLTTLLTYLVSTSLNNLNNYPIIALTLACLSVLSFGLLMVWFIYRTSGKLTRFLIKLFFPDGHPRHG